MLTECANPACFARFHYFHQGRLFTIEPRIDRPKRGPPADPEYASEPHRVEHFWLCSACCHAMTVESGGNGGVAVVRKEGVQVKTFVMEDDTRRVA